MKALKRCKNYQTNEQLKETFTLVAIKIIFIKWESKVSREAKTVNTDLLFTAKTKIINLQSTLSVLITV